MKNSLSAISSDFKSQSIIAKIYVLHVKALLKNRFQLDNLFFKLFNNKQIIYVNLNDHLDFIINENVVINFNDFEIKKSKKVDENVISHSKKLF